MTPSQVTRLQHRADSLADWYRKTDRHPLDFRSRIDEEWQSYGFLDPAFIILANIGLFVFMIASSDY